MASIHAEVPNDADIEEAHELIDRIERDAVDELGILLVIHMDPIEMRDEQVMTVRGEVEAALKELDSQCSIHDLRVVNGMGQIQSDSLIWSYHLNMMRKKKIICSFN